MKLEAVNGNLLNLLKGPPTDDETAVDAAEKGATEKEEAEAKEEQNEGEGEASGKKKNARKKRSLNWEEAERGLLLEVIKPKVDYVENRNVDAKSIKAKRLAWLQITKQFNALNFRHRSLEQIQVQWRSMKNSAKREHQQKNPKANVLEGMEMIEFMEELQKDPATTRSQTRGGGAAAATAAAAAALAGALTLKKELLEMDDEDTPLAALPTSTNTSEDTLQSSTLALPSPPPSAESQNETQQAAPTRNKKKLVSGGGAQKQQASGGNKPKRQRSQNSTLSADTAASIDSQTIPTHLPLASHPSAVTPSSSASSTCVLAANGTTSNADDNRYKKQLFELMKRARLAEMDYARREHEQKLRFEQLEQELKLQYCRQREELKLRQLRDEHEAHMRHWQAEHEARMRVYTLNTKNKNAKVEPIDGNVF